MPSSLTNKNSEKLGMFKLSPNLYFNYWLFVFLLSLELFTIIGIFMIAEHYVVSFISLIFFTFLAILLVLSAQKMEDFAIRNLSTIPKSLEIKVDIFAYSFLIMFSFILICLISFLFNKTL